MYEVLDVREYKGIAEGEYRQNYGTVGGNINVRTTHCTVVICTDLETGMRVRFEFYPGYKDEFLGKTRYYGYVGDFNLIVPGDLINILETSTYKKVEIISAN